MQLDVDWHIFKFRFPIKTQTNKRLPIRSPALSVHFKELALPTGSTLHYCWGHTFVRSAWLWVTPHDPAVWDRLVHVEPGAFGWLPHCMSHRPSRGVAIEGVGSGKTCLIHKYSLPDSCECECARLLRVWPLLTWTQQWQRYSHSKSN